MLILLYGCTTWTPTERIAQKLDGNYARMLLAILNKSWRQHPTKQHLYRHQPPIKIRRTRHARNYWRNRDKLISDVLQWTLHMDEQRLDDRLEPTCSSSVPMRDVVLKTRRKQWTIGKGSEKKPGISALMTRRDDDADIWICVEMSKYKVVNLGNSLTRLNVFSNYKLWF